MEVSKVGKDDGGEIRALEFRASGPLVTLRS
jgi:hypothetical protein